jgi:hypothetical protein
MVYNYHVLPELPCYLVLLGDRRLIIRDADPEPASPPCGVVNIWSFIGGWPKILAPGRERRLMEPREARSGNLRRKS